jgi:hypothetical protein
MVSQQKSESEEQVDGLTEQHQGRHSLSLLRRISSMFGQRGQAEEPESISVMDVELNHNRLSIASVGSTMEIPGSSGNQLSAGKGLEQSVADFDAEQEGIELGDRPSAISNTPREKHVVDSGLEEQLAQALLEIKEKNLLITTMTAELSHNRHNPAA